MLGNSTKTSIEQTLTKPSAEISIINIVESIIEFAYDSRASDIHLSPTENAFKVRVRIDGVLQDSFTVPVEIHQEIISRIKVLSGLRTDEHNTPQDGRFKFMTKDKKTRFDIRVSIMPTHYGENAVLRLLVEQGETFNLENIGFSKRDIKAIRHAISKPYGMILATGPTGSGKTTTLYTILRELNNPDVSIITIEDPIEYSLEGVDQIQVNSQTGLTFARGLRSILRQDPNIIMVGEIRDNETAGIAVNAALTGHLLLSTLHTNDAATTLPRLLDMEIEPFLIASTVNIAIGQRLVRKLCNICKLKKELTEKELESLKETFPMEHLGKSKIFYSPVGCKECSKTGYISRIGIHEVLEMTEAIRNAIVARASSAEIRRIAISEGMTTMLQDGINKAKEGITSLEEILRVIHE
ncbi:MAG: type II/IV secretion system protein [Candidatus Colwellbacteria bacterium]|nr:type II/IV secretion system protein [Candidatus Colwellbacteria bacterium]